MPGGIHDFTTAEISQNAKFAKKHDCSRLSDKHAKVWDPLQSPISEGVPTSTREGLVLWECANFPRCFLGNNTLQSKK